MTKQEAWERLPEDLQKKVTWLKSRYLSIGRACEFINKHLDYFKELTTYFFGA